MRNAVVYSNPTRFSYCKSIFIILSVWWMLLPFSTLSAQTKIITADQIKNNNRAPNISKAPLQNNSTSSTLNIGFEDYAYGSAVVNAPTGEKPESKLWWNDDIWWGSMWDPSANEYRIYRLNSATEAWENTGVPIDDRSTTKADALWDGNKLYVASHIFDEGGGSAGQNEAARLYRYSYNTSIKEYTLDTGFPVEINSSTSETLVIDKDYSGKLWITWTQSGEVWINASTTDDLHWNTPIQLPVQTSTAKSDDIASLQHFDDNKIGLLWSDQNARKMFFAIHLDGANFDDWQAAETALNDAGNAAVADDHINLKMGKDGQGNLYAVTKTSLSDSNDPLIYLLKRDRFGVWTSYVFGYNRDHHTRPIILIDESNNLLYVFAMGTVSGVNSIYMKTSDLNNISFPLGVGTPFIQNTAYDDINNPTSTKQTVNNRMGLVVLASDATQNVYFHNTIPANVSMPAIASFTPANGIPGDEVTINGEHFSGATAVKFNGLEAASFMVISDNQVQAEVPAGAATGPISVYTPEGFAISIDDFVIQSVPQIASFTPGSGEVGAEVTISGSGYVGVNVVEFNAAAASFTVDSDATIRAEVPSGAVTGKISVSNAAGTAVSADDFVVLYPPVIASFSPGSAAPGAEITIQGSHFTGATAVGFNGTEASTFFIDSDSQIRATVPEGALAGPISVTGPDGAGVSADDFVVLILPQITAFLPDNGPAGAEVNISGHGFSTTLTVEFNGVSAASFNVIADDQLTAVVPAGAATGPISITNTIGAATSASNFTIPEPPFTLSVFYNGPGTVQLSPEPDLSGGIYNSITEVTLTAVPDPGYTFAGWSGDLNGTANPGTILVNSDKSIIASFIEEGGGPVVYEETQTGGSASSGTVSLSTPITLVNGDLYLAAISFKNYTTVESVAGLNLAWALVMEQCSGRSQTGVSVWMARGNPGGDGIVTATLTSAPTNAVIAVSRYSGVHNSTPLGTVISGNTNGLNGDCANGTDVSTYDLDFNTTQQGSVIFGAVAMRNKTHTPGSGYTERVETGYGSGGNMAGLATVDREVANPALVSLNGSFNGSVDWAVVGVELISGNAGGGLPHYTLTVDINGGGGTVSLNPAVPGNSYPAGTTVTLTANPDPGFLFNGWSGDLGGLSNPETIVMNGNKSVTAAFGPMEISVVNVRAFLEGPYQNGGMSTALRDNGRLPLAQSYNAYPWNYGGDEAVDDIPAGVVDWVLIGLRSTETEADLAHRAAFIKSDGSIVEISGSGGVEFAGVEHGDYFVVIYHRNHLSIMSNSALPLTNASALYDFSSASSQAYGSKPMAEMETGVFGMISGDGNSDGAVNNADRLVWRKENGTAWLYGKGGDFNLDGGIDASDLNYSWRANNGSLTGVPGVATLAAPFRKQVQREEEK